MFPMIINTLLLIHLDSVVSFNGFWELIFVIFLNKPWIRSRWDWLRWITSQYSFLTLWHWYASWIWFELGERSQLEEGDVSGCGSPLVRDKTLIVASVCSHDWTDSDGALGFHLYIRCRCNIQFHFVLVPLKSATRNCIYLILGLDYGVLHPRENIKLLPSRYFQQSTGIYLYDSVSDE